MMTPEQSLKNALEELVQSPDTSLSALLRLADHLAKKHALNAAQAMRLRDEARWNSDAVEKVA